VFWSLLKWCGNWWRHLAIVAAQWKSLSDLHAVSADWRILPRTKIVLVSEILVSADVKKGSTRQLVCASIVWEVQMAYSELLWANRSKPLETRKYELYSDGKEANRLQLRKRFVGDVSVLEHLVAVQKQSIPIEQREEQAHRLLSRLQAEGSVSMDDVCFGR